MSLPAGLLSRPIAHRGLHELARGIPENSLAAAEAACRAGYAIELDLQPSLDGVAMVFHDDRLDRLAGRPGLAAETLAADLEAMPILGTAERVPRFAAFLDLVAGRVPLLVELKSQPGSPVTATAKLAELALAALDGYRGEVAVMSFNPYAVAHGAMLRPDLAWGVTTGHGPGLFPQDPALDAQITGGPLDPRDYGGCFISHGLHAAEATWIGPLRAAGLPVLAWTVRSPEDEVLARRFAANITFEGYRPALPAAGLDRPAETPK
ncbi:glycerophosphodiester phosphodiesterase family protein [Poseidonocella sp. HB161398]|uniref:glycerophosphodiester phosphodiesterase family protein n=1 Tax=Poseidonocella sp. HB161398 TaxID=2320855 RepID=UPI001107B2C7|nr:glycerophosphodiester phosphodiesterase family protein [Poseidonocella sp. HB161398]